LKDEQTAGEIKLSEGQTMHMVSKPSGKKVESKPSTEGSSEVPSSSSQPNPFGGMGGFGGFPGMMSGGGASGMGGMNLDPNAI
jgi:hypothetical protein